MTAHRTTIRVRFYELDPYNHVNHSVYVSYFESARVELLAEAGYSLASMRANGRSIVVSEIQTKFHASAEGPVRFDDAMLDALSIYAAAPSDPEPT
ncbi:MAG: acyl-CoA thioesterase [Actinobacteria bacterium]|nr:acyl-CoA thioesterase [Actinomycetota bacterium]